MLRSLVRFQLAPPATPPRVAGEPLLLIRQSFTVGDRWYACCDLAKGTEGTRRKERRWQKIRTAWLSEAARRACTGVSFARLQDSASSSRHSQWHWRTGKPQASSRRTVR